MGSYEQTMLKLEKMAQANTATQMNWQEKMSKTSHQMEVADLVKAGLNPVLSANQGASSYTTSVDSAVNGIAGMASAREGANAQRFAARQGAAATRYAAMQSAAATRAAAASNLEAARLAANTSNLNNIRDNEYARMINFANNQQQKWNIQNQQANNLFSAIDKITQKNGMQNAILGSSYLKNNISSLSKFMDNPYKYTKSGLQKAATNFTQLSSGAANSLLSFIKKLGLNNNSATRNLAFKATFGHSGVALESLLRQSYKKRKSSASGLYQYY